MIIGVVGRTTARDGRSCSINTGKDTVSDVLVQEFSLVKMAIADDMKRFLHTLGFTKEQLWGPSDKRAEPNYEVGGISARHAAKTLGTEWGRQLMYPDIWVDRAIRTAKQLLEDPQGSVYIQEEGVVPRVEFTPMGEMERDGVPSGPCAGVIFSDVRFRNELNAIRRNRGTLILVRRFVDEIPPEVDCDHPSESELADVRNDEFDYVIYNDDTLAVLEGKARSAIIKLVGSLPSPPPGAQVVGMVLDSRIIPKDNPLHNLVAQREKDVAAGRIVPTSAEDLGSDIPPFMRDEGCECADWTHVGHSKGAYYPLGEGEIPTGHHPDCEHYTPPPPMQGRTRLT